VRRVTAKQLAGVRRFQVGVVVCKCSAALPLVLDRLEQGSDADQLAAQPGTSSCRVSEAKWGP
jgi:hypothetical protein